MGYWEFLLQKEGDQSWLPLDTAQVEILEGRYRIMAHTSLANTPVNVQISQLGYGPQPSPTKDNRSLPKRRTLRRQTATNDSGLMVVMPFTRLGEGTWDLLCTSVDSENSASDDSAPGAPAAVWRYGVQLRVVAQDSNEEGDWFADDGSGGILGAGGRAPSPPDQSRVAPGSALGGEAIRAAIPPGIAAALDEFQRRIAAGLEEATSPYRLTLHQTALLGSEGETLGLPATVDADLAQGADLSLVVRLANPQTAATVALTSTPLVSATLPAGVTLSITVPADLSTRLLLGEVGLLADDELVAVQGFTVTVDVAALFNAIANQAETDADLGVNFPTEEEPEAAATPTIASPKPLDLAGEGTPPRELPILTLPRSSPALPPKIYYPSPHEVAAHQPTLPPVGQIKPTALPDPETDPETAPESGSETAPKTAPETAPAQPKPPRGLSLPPLASPPRADTPAGIESGRSPTSARPAAAQPPQLISHEAMGFKQLNLQDRFWNRLNELAITLQQEALATQVAPAEAEQPPPEPTGGEEEAPAFIPFAGEVVIYDDEDPSLKDLQATPAAVPPPESAVEIVTPPVPQLVLPEADLIAGEPVLVTVRVPFHPNRLYLKVWITDPQTRTLADEPRQLMNLLPNGQGHLEGSLQLTAPLGCLEACFEAIAVDLVTHQESYKATVSRTITPAGLSPSSLDEFQI
jgi:hypothetical protein